MTDQHTLDPLSVAVRAAREAIDPTRTDGEIAAAVLTALLHELPEHFGDHAGRAYRFWLRNRIAALHAGKPFHPWVLTTSYMQYPDLLALDPP